MNRYMRKLLVVDDDEALRRLLRLELSESYEITDSGQPEEGLALALESKPDAILLDLRMPKYSGYELCQTFANFSRTQKVPIVIISGEAGAQTKEYCKQLGATAYFEKPIDFEALRASLNQIVKPRTYTSRTEARLQLRIPLKLAGTDRHGKKFEESGYTENVSLSGFGCNFTTELSPDSVVEVFLTKCGAEYVGKAILVPFESSKPPIVRYGFRFIERSGPWVLC